MNNYKVVSDYTPKGDQPKAISALAQGINDGYMGQTLLGVTGSGKTFTIANTIAKVNRPTLVLAHNKTLAAQLCSEFKEFFPNSAVEFFVSYYDYYQPEAYIPHTDTYIEKDASTNDEIDKLRHSATAALFERRDVIVVASVSCIYGLGDPIDYNNLVLSLRTCMRKERDEVLARLISIQYERNDIDFKRSTFRVRGDVVEIIPSHQNANAVRVEFFGDEVERISEINVITGEILGVRDHCVIFPASHYVTTQEKRESAIITIEEELEERVQWFKDHDKLVEAQRILQRTRYDIEMMREVGFCNGIENYSRHISGRPAGSAPFTLMDYFPDDYLLVADEAHVSIPQVRAMYAGDRSRKENLVDFGFRLPSAFDNRPLCFEEFEERINQVVFVSATPAEYERTHSAQIVEQVIRPTGLIDPEIEVRPVKSQVDDLVGEINKRTAKNERVLITTLTKRMAEDLTEYFKDLDIKVQYMHSDVVTMERMEIIRDLRAGVYDVLVGINLLREGLDIPEVSLVAILDADKEGFLRNETSLVQTIGRAARNAEGKVIMYAERITDSMQRAIDETNRRRKIQQDYNEEHGIVPATIKKGIREVIEATKEDKKSKTERDYNNDIMDKNLRILQLTDQMNQAAQELQFEKAAQLRDKIKKLRTDM